jgi:predicted metal-dependent peptidase
MEIHVLYVDAGVGKHYTVGPYDELDYGIVGRGGTDFEVAFAYVADHGGHIDLMVYVTDGFAPRPTTKLPCQTIWLLTANGQSNMHDQPGHTVLQMRDYSVGESP